MEAAAIRDRSYILRRFAVARKDRNNGGFTSQVSTRAGAGERIACELRWGVFNAAESERTPTKSSTRSPECVPRVYVANNYGSAAGSVTVYAAGATGNAKPIQNISGSNTDLGGPSGIAVDADGNNSRQTVASVAAMAIQLMSSLRGRLVTSPRSKSLRGITPVYFNHVAWPWTP